MELSRPILCFFANQTHPWIEYARREVNEAAHYIDQTALYRANPQVFDVTQIVLSILLSIK